MSKAVDFVSKMTTSVKTGSFDNRKVSSLRTVITEVGFYMNVPHMQHTFILMVPRNLAMIVYCYLGQCDGVERGQVNLTRRL